MSDSPLPCPAARCSRSRSEEHTSELQSRENLVCRLLLEKSKRWLIAQWKEDPDPSPIEAARCANRVCHLTVPDAESRRVIAAADGACQRLEALFPRRPLS